LTHSQFIHEAKCETAPQSREDRQYRDRGRFIKGSHIFNEGDKLMNISRLQDGLIPW
jgi:hypothetical protein